MQKIWQKSEKLKSSFLTQIVEDFTVGNDYQLDQKLIPYDLKASQAHAQMLHKIGILSKNELAKLTKGLLEIKVLWKKGKFVIQKSDEDCHTAIEKFLTTKYGEVGKKIHTGRSRNDQVLVAIRLFQKESLNKFFVQTQDLINSFKEKIKVIGNIKMPGYTHMQRAMPSTVGMWLSGFVSSLEDNLVLLKSTQKIIDQNPLGSAAGFGENILGINREYTAKKLGFAKVQKNPMYCAYSRGKFENIILQSLNNFMLDFGKFSNDLLLFTTKEFNFFILSDEFLTGSSIMPQKKNYDVLELLRGKCSIFLGYQYQIQEIIKNLPSGYNRDFQLIKEPFFNAIKLFEQCLSMMNLIVQNLEAKKENLENACSEEIYATDKVYELVKQGVSFRKAYQKIGQEFE